MTPQTSTDSGYDTDDSLDILLDPEVGMSKTALRRRRYKENCRKRLAAQAIGQTSETEETVGAARAAEAEGYVGAKASAEAKGAVEAKEAVEASESVEVKTEPGISKAARNRRKYKQNLRRRLFAEAATQSGEREEPVVAVAEPAMTKSARNRQLLADRYRKEIAAEAATENDTRETTVEGEPSEHANDGSFIR